MVVDDSPNARAACHALEKRDGRAEVKQTEFGGPEEPKVETSRSALSAPIELQDPDRHRVVARTRRENKKRRSVIPNGPLADAYAPAHHALLYNIVS